MSAPDRLSLFSLFRQDTTVPFLTFVVLMSASLAHFAASAAEPESTSNEKAVPPPSRPLDLRTPDITELLSADELAQLIKGTVDTDLNEVKVEGVRDLPPPDTPVVWPGLLAPLWALTHPTQAWRIFAPLPSDQVKDDGERRR